jgi:hypothetical protein
MSKLTHRTPTPGFPRVLVVLLGLILAGTALAARAQETPPEKKPAPPPRSGAPRLPGLPLKSWREMQAEAKAYPAKQLAEMKKTIRSFRIVRQPRAVISGYDANPDLWKSLTGFYDFIKGRELDMYAEQTGIPEFFPSREAYYDFLDTIVPAMRDRAFERNRLLSYRVHEIKITDDSADVTMSIVSDDSLHLGKSMVFRQHWISQGYRWYPGKVAADAATVWEKVK